MPEFPTTIEVKKLNREHPEYSFNAGMWKDVSILKTGGITLAKEIERFLQKAPKEPSDVYAIRANNATYQNVLGSAIGWYVARLFRQNPEIELENAQWEEWLADCDRNGTMFVDFLPRIFESCALYKRAFILTDLPSVDEPPADRAEEMARKTDTPFLRLYEPLSVINWELDEYGNLEWLIIRCEEPMTASPFEEEGCECTWYWFDTTSYAVYEWKGKKGEKPNGEATRVKVGEHFAAKVGQVPVVMVEIPDILWLANRAYLQIKDHLNHENQVKWSLAIANLAQLVISGDFNDQSLTMSEVRAMLLKEGSTASYLEPSGTSFDISDKRLQYLREEIYRCFYLQAQGRSSAATPAMQSGYSKEVDMAPANDILNKFGDVIRQAATRILRMVALARGLDPASVSAIRGYRFDHSTPMNEVVLAQAIVDLDIVKSPEFERQMARRVARAYTEDASPEIQTKIENEIDANPTTSEAAAQEQTDSMKSFKTGFDKVVQTIKTGATQQEIAA